MSFGGIKKNDVTIEGLESGTAYKAKLHAWMNNVKYLVVDDKHVPTSKCTEQLRAGTQLGTFQKVYRVIESVRQFISLSYIYFLLLITYLNTISKYLKRKLYSKSRLSTTITHYKLITYIYKVHYKQLQDRDQQRTWTSIKRLRRQSGWCSENRGGETWRNTSSQYQDTMMRRISLKLLR